MENELSKTEQPCTIHSVSGSFFDKYEKSEITDLQKVSECRDRVLMLIHSSNLHEDIIEHLLEPFENLLEYNGVNLQETDY